MTSDQPEPPVAIDVVFERFPASIRGAVVVRGRDPEPHHVRLADLAVVEAHAGGRAAHQIPVGDLAVDVVPRGEMLIPFDVAFAELRPGWFVVAAEVVVDGQVRIRGPEEAKRFVVPWPSGEVRRGVVDAGLPIRVPGSEGAFVERLECKPDRTVVRWRHAPGDDPAVPEFPDLRVFAGSRRLHPLESTHEAASGARTTVVLPVLKRHHRLTFELDRRTVPGGRAQRGKWAATLDLP